LCLNGGGDHVRLHGQVHHGVGGGPGDHCDRS
jgi:hypothetical protein